MIRFDFGLVTWFFLKSFEESFFFTKLGDAILIGYINNHLLIARTFFTSLNLNTQIFINKPLIFRSFLKSILPKVINVQEAVLPDLVEFHKSGVFRGQIVGKFLVRWNFISGEISGVFRKWQNFVNCLQ